MRDKVKKLGIISTSVALAAALLGSEPIASPANTALAAQSSVLTVGLGHGNAVAARNATTLLGQKANALDATKPKAKKKAKKKPKAKAKTVASQPKTVKLSLSGSTDIVHVSTNQVLVISISGGSQLANASCDITFAGKTATDVLDDSGNLDYYIQAVSYASYYSATFYQTKGVTPFSVSCANTGYEGSQRVNLLLTR